MRLFLVYLDNGKIAIIHAADITAAITAFYGEAVEFTEIPGHKFASSLNDIFHDMGVISENTVITVKKWAII